MSWYTWLEQGRDITVSTAVLDAVAAALRLDAAEHRHLHLLAGLPAPVDAARASRPVPDELRRVLDGWLPRPAYVIDRHWNFVAVNRAAELVFGYGVTDHNCLITFFTNVRYRAALSQWRDTTADMVALFRAESAQYPTDSRFDEIAADLAQVSEEFAELWQRHDVGEPGSNVKAIMHPEVGDLVFENVPLPIPGRPGEQLILHNPLPGTETQSRLEALVGVNQVVPNPG